MTLKEIVKEKQPYRINDDYGGGVDGCPCEYEYLRKYLGAKENHDLCYEHCYENVNTETDICNKCWNREINKLSIMTNIIKATTENNILNLNNTDLEKVARKILEEAGEVIDAQANYKNNSSYDNCQNLVGELLDVIQMSINMLQQLKDKTDFNLAIVNHNYKLSQRGWKFSEFGIEFTNRGKK